MMHYDEMLALARVHQAELRREADVRRMLRQDCGCENKGSRTLARLVCLGSRVMSFVL